MKKLGLLVMVAICGTAFAYEVPMQGQPQVMPQVKEMAKIYGLSEDTINKMPKSLVSSSDGKLTSEMVEEFKGLAEDMCDTFKDAEVTFYLGLNHQGQLAITSGGLGQGFEVKLKC